MCNAARAFLAGHPGPALVPTSIMVCRIAVRSLTGRLVTLDVRSDFTISELISAVMGSAEAWASEPVGTAQKNIVHRLSARPPVRTVRPTGHPSAPSVRPATRPSLQKVLT